MTTARRPGPRSAMKEVAEAALTLREFTALELTQYVTAAPRTVYRHVRTLARRELIRESGKFAWHGAVIWKVPEKKIAMLQGLVRREEAKVR